MVHPGFQTANARGQCASRGHPPLPVSGDPGTTAIRVLHQRRETAYGALKRRGVLAPHALRNRGKETPGRKPGWRRRCGSPWHGDQNNAHTAPAHLARRASAMRTLPGEKAGRYAIGGGRNNAGGKRKRRKPSGWNRDITDVVTCKKHKANNTGGIKTPWRSGKAASCLRAGGRRARACPSLDTRDLAPTTY